MHQVATNSHPTTVLKRKRKRIGTWNVRSLYKAGKLYNMKKEMERLKVNIMALSEVRWNGAGTLRTDEQQTIYSGKAIHSKGVGIVLDSDTAKTL